MTEIYFVNFVPSLIKEWRNRRQELLEKWERGQNDTNGVKSLSEVRVLPGNGQKTIEDELSKLANRYLHRCLVNINTKKRVLTIKDSIINQENCQDLNFMLEDLQNPGLQKIRQIDTNILKVVENVTLFKRALPKLSLVKLSSYLKGLPVMKFNVQNGEIRHLILTNERFDSDDSSSLGNILQGLSEQYLKNLEVTNCVFDYTFQPNLHSNSKLTTLTLAGSCFADTPHALNLLGALSSLITLDLNSCGLDTDCIGSLKKLFTENHSIENLNLSNNNFGHKDNELLRTIAILKNLKILHLYHCMLSRNCATGLNAISQGNSRTLKKLTLNFNHFKGNPEVLLAVADCIALEELYLYKAEIMSRNCSSLKQILQNSEKLRLLDLSCNNLGGGDDILQSLSVCKNLVKLGLYNCTLMDCCIGSIGSVLKSNKKLKELNLSGNKFIDHRSLFNVLRFGRRLEQLYLKDINLEKPPLPSLFDENSDNEKHPDGALVMTASAEQTALEQAFQEFVQASPNLQVIEFACNELWATFIDKMVSWTQLQELYLYQCELNYNSVNSLIAVLKVNENLRVLDLEGNAFEKTRDLFATLADSSITSIDLRQISLEDKRFEQIVHLIKTARARHEKIKKLLKTSANKPSKSDSVNLSGVDHIWITDNNSLTVAGLNKVLMGVDDEDRISSAPRGVEERQKGNRRRASLISTKAEFLERINDSKTMPIIH